MFLLSAFGVVGWGWEGCIISDCIGDKGIEYTR
jgi:hypothetical protein